MDYTILEQEKEPIEKEETQQTIVETLEVTPYQEELLNHIKSIDDSLLFIICFIGCLFGLILIKCMWEKLT